MHWRKLVSIANPDADGVRRREFTSDAAASSFAALVNVIVTAVCVADSSPSILAMLMRLLELLNKVGLSCL